MKTESSSKEKEKKTTSRTVVEGKLTLSERENLEKLLNASSSMFN